MDHALQNWNLTVSQLSIYFEGRLDDVLDIQGFVAQIGFEGFIV